MNPEMETRALAALREANLNWAVGLDDVWRDSSSDVAELHRPVRERFAEQLRSMRAAGDGRADPPASPLGWMLVGSGGVGKTHLLGAMRREAARQRAGFVLVDMTDVHRFWDAVLQGYLDSLQNEYVGGQFQHQVLLQGLIARFTSENRAGELVGILAGRRTQKLAEDVQTILSHLAKKDRRRTREFSDVIRALVCLNSDNFDISSDGYAYLQAQPLDETKRAELGFRNASPTPRELVRGLSWFMSLSGPAVVAFDQLDPIVQQVNHRVADPQWQESEEYGKARSIIEEIGGGLGAMRDTTFNTLSVVTCVETTLSTLDSLVLHTYLERFEPQRHLKRPATGDALRSVVQRRLAPVYQAHRVEPPYPSWPFAPEAFDELANESVREVLKLCDRARRKWIESERINPLVSFVREGNSSDPSSVAAPSVDEELCRLDAKYQDYQQSADPEFLLEEKEEDERLAPLFQVALECQVLENSDALDGQTDAVVERDFGGGKTTKPLHARLRIIHHGESGREQHHCVRALQRRHAGAYKARLKAAMTQAGIDQSLSFRHLVIVRRGDQPGGAQTKQRIREFTEAGGRFHSPSDQELKVLEALRRMAVERDRNFGRWLASRRPASGLPLARTLEVPWADAAARPSEPQVDRADWREPEPETRPAAPLPGPPAGPAAGHAPPPPPSAAPPAPAAAAGRSTAVRQPEPPPPTNGSSRRDRPAPAVSSALELPENARVPENLEIGNRIVGRDRIGELVSIPLAALSKHTLIMGGSGSGKSVTVRRVIEQAALAGIPSIVVDCAQDMCCFDQAWPQPPEHWREGDAERAERFHQRTHQVVWTPGTRSSGNPLTLRPLPDFAPVRDDPEELDDAIEMASAALEPVVAGGKSDKAKVKSAILRESLRYFAREFADHSLDAYIDLLSEFPAEAGMQVPEEAKLASQMATQLKVERTNNRLLSSDGTPLDPLRLFGDDDPSRRSVRISVISLVKLKGPTEHQSFLNQLAMELFSWIKRNPTPPGGRPLRGLLVVDEARDFVPSQRASECKESMMRLAAQARKYRMGVVLATQHPREIESRIVGNCATHFYGLNNSPASLATLQDLIRQKGGSGSEIASLKAGQFYVHNADAGHVAPVKVRIPMSLSYSPPSPLEEERILQLAEPSRPEPMT